MVFIAMFISITFYLLVFLSSFSAERHSCANVVSLFCASINKIETKICQVVSMCIFS